MERRWKKALGRKAPYAIPFFPKRDRSLKAKTQSRTARKQSLSSNVDSESHSRENTMNQVNLAQLRGANRIRHNTVQIRLDLPAWKLRNLTMNDLQLLRRKWMSPLPFVLHKVQPLPYHL
ncbi:hypothetical protein NDU88_002968 [Pleurodeles waltl]|uniref:Uncharacterized protein n=1 Tax=Pleurodeles waltl TaxID=8319 RepID=A0AAV7Q892_PLEWA|nr:hypothetical protein NDU88_002968 [Pleurodeles waltl]